jgi:hypothetical protein
LEWRSRKDLTMSSFRDAVLPPVGQAPTPMTKVLEQVAAVNQVKLPRKGKFVKVIVIIF